MKKSVVIFVLLTALLVMPAELFARIGVGIGTAKVELNEALNPGSLHNLPSFSVINTGDEPSEYEVGVEYQENIPQLRPSREWFSFNPQQFHLDPGESQVVDIDLNLPVKAEPGDYFAYIEGRPMKKSTGGDGTSIGIAAAAKLYFSIKPANFFAGVYYRVHSLWIKYAPWTYVVSGVIVATIAVNVLSRFISFDVNIRKRKLNNKINGEQKEDRAVSSEDVTAILATALRKVEEYTSKLPENDFEKAMLEARSRKKDIKEFFYKDNQDILGQVSPELKNILSYSREGLEDVKFKGKDIYTKVLNIVVSGIVD